MADYFGLDIIRKNAPIMIFLNYHKYYTLKFPINPEELKKNIPSPSQKVTIEGIGEVANPSSTKLATINIASFFWQDRNMVPTSLYVDWLEKWQRSKEPAKLIVTKLNYSMYVTCENFVHTTKAGEEDDVYFELELQEYRPFGAKKINDIPNPSFWGKVEDTLNKWDKNLSASILFEIPRPERFANNAVILNPYTTKEGDTLLSITKKARGTTSGWKDLYELNKEKLGDILGEGKEISSGTKLNIPDEWIKASTREVMSSIL